ncbi:uncharacterized protein LOC118791114 [Megalops cyprinoides]|uniref:uncharacterized protein LOC118791114 n=1 Tax=Megalops cyprinoides TaxID=118141 RepID=UPI001863CD72|nr:uncharacterized protein LOC118791114 [Megalops cyprinoides]
MYTESYVSSYCMRHLLAMSIQPFSFPLPETRFFQAGHHVYKFKIRSGSKCRTDERVDNECISQELEVAIRVVLANLDSLQPFATKHFNIFPYKSRWEKVSELHFQQGKRMLAAYPFLLMLYLETRDTPHMLPDVCSPLPLPSLSCPKQNTLCFSSTPEERPLRRAVVSTVEQDQPLLSHSLACLPKSSSTEQPPGSSPTQHRCTTGLELPHSASQAEVMEGDRRVGPPPCHTKRQPKERHPELVLHVLTSTQLQAHSEPSHSSPANSSVTQQEGPGATGGSGEPGGHHCQAKHGDPEEPTPCTGETGSPGVLSYMARKVFALLFFLGSWKK